MSLYRKGSNIMRVLVLAPHTDDGELGCGGTIVRFIEEGNEVHYVAFSTASESVPPGLPKNILEVEIIEATGILGIKEENLHIYKHTVRKLNYVRQDILEEMIDIRKNLKPDLVLLPSINDIHQDHNTIAQEAIRAFKQTSMYAYELPWNTITFSTQCFIRLEERHLEKKVKALSAYKSQSEKAYCSREFIVGLATTRGVQIGVHYAESFEVIRQII